MLIQELLFLREDAPSQEADKILRRLLAYAHNDVSDSDQKQIKLDIARRLEQGWLADEIVDYARHQEAIQPDLDEDKALARMKLVKDKVKKRLASVNESAQLFEGMFVVKNIDGKEKRFKDVHSAEARAWRSSRSKIAKPKSVKYSQEWWEDKEYDVSVVPWDKIGNDDLDFKDKTMIDVVEAAHIDPKTVDYASVKKNFKKTVDGVETAHAEIRMTYEYNAADLGIDDDSGNDNGSGLEGVWFVIRRDTKQPDKFKFVEFTG